MADNKHNRSDEYRNNRSERDENFNDYNPFQNPYEQEGYQQGNRQGASYGNNMNNYSGDDPRMRNRGQQDQYGSVNDHYRQGQRGDQYSGSGDQDRYQPPYRSQNFGQQGSGSFYEQRANNQYRQRDDQHNRDDYRQNYANRFGTMGGHGSEYGEGMSMGPFTNSGFGGQSDDYRRNERESFSGWNGANADRNRDNNRHSGPHRGKGPKDYQRSEQRIREDICDRLSDDDRVDASNIRVQIENNEVILTGTVGSREEKRRAEDLIESVSGVRNVENRLRVGRAEDFESRDYTGSTDLPGGIGTESGTTMEIIRNEQNKERRRRKQ